MKKVSLCLVLAMLSMLMTVFPALSEQEEAEQLHSLWGLSYSCTEEDILRAAGMNGHSMDIVEIPSPSEKVIQTKIYRTKKPIRIGKYEYSLEIDFDVEENEVRSPFILKAVPKKPYSTVSEFLNYYFDMYEQFKKIFGKEDRLFFYERGIDPSTHAMTYDAYMIEDLSEETFSILETFISSNADRRTMPPQIEADWKNVEMTGSYSYGITIYLRDHIIQAPEYTGTIDDLPLYRMFTTTESK